MNVVLGDPGVLVIATDVDDAIIDRLREWLPTYLRVAAVTRDLPVPQFPSYASYNNPADMSEWADTGYPGIMVATSRTAARPVRQREGNYSVGWTVQVSAVVRGGKAQDTRHRAALYEGAVRNAVGKRGWPNGGIVHSAYWQASETRPLTPVGRAGRYLAAGMATFLVMTDAAFSEGPGLPAPDPPAPDVPPPYVPTATITPIPVVTIEPKP